jgi:hypothetical protein
MLLSWRVCGAVRKQQIRVLKISASDSHGNSAQCRAVSEALNLCSIVKVSRAKVITIQAYSSIAHPIPHGDSSYFRVSFALAGNVFGPPAQSLYSSLGWHSG